MATKPRGRKPKQNEQAAKLLAALETVNLIKSPTATSQPYHFHTQLRDGWAVAFDGIVAIGAPTGMEDTSFRANPHLELMLDAISHVGKDFTMAMHHDHMEVVSGDYTARVPMIADDMFIAVAPDNSVAPINEQFIGAAEAVGKIVSDTAPDLVHASIRTGGVSVMSYVDGTFIEAWHGCDMPPGLLLPKQFVTVLAKMKRTPVSFGVDLSNWKTLTIYFEGGEWVRTNLYDGAWPDAIVNKAPSLFEGAFSVSEVPKGLFNAVEYVAPFAKDDLVSLSPGMVRSAGAAFALESVQYSINIRAAKLAKVEPLVQLMGFNPETPNGGTAIIFYGNDNKVRGAIAGAAEAVKAAEPPPPEPSGWGNNTAPFPPPGAQLAPAQPGETQNTTFQPGADAGGAESMNEAPAPLAAPMTGASPSEYTIVNEVPEPARREAAPAMPWLGGPPEGLGGDPEFEQNRQDTDNPLAPVTMFFKRVVSNEPTQYFSVLVGQPLPPISDTTLTRVSLEEYEQATFTPPAVAQDGWTTS